MKVWAHDNTIVVSNVKGKTMVRVFNPIGQLLKTVQTSADMSFLALGEGIWLVSIIAPDGEVTNKVFTRK